MQDKKGIFLFLLPNIVVYKLDTEQMTSKFIHLKSFLHTEQIYQLHIVLFGFLHRFISFICHLYVLVQK
jgi:hypothetical protein